ncbi:PucR family transcriptional regulator [Streptomyces odontomachi]|uniref:PucR family transcriptional regulator n=1 Tax=Streptomyces odontomachi TaxID=2944940 RepID=UPI002108B7F4|nr:helix-turn-helix domain-containing protein [Streptomyces sp. ODS25]
MKQQRPSSTLPLLLTDLLRIEPLASAVAAVLPEPTRRVEQVILAETFDRLRHSTPHALVVLHAEAATGGWSLAAALHVAWERNVSALAVPRSVSSPSNRALAESLGVAVLFLDTDPVAVALRLAGQVSAPQAARARQRAGCAERLANETTLRGVLGVLNDELGTAPVALVVDGTVLAGRPAAVETRPDVEQVSVDVHAPGGQPWARLVAAVPADVPAAVLHTEALLRLARPSLLAAWAQTRLDVATHAAHEQAAFGLLRRLAGETAAGSPTGACPVDDVPPWTTELGWHVGGVNRAVWLTPLRARPEPPPELTHLVRAAWQRTQPNWPLVTEDDGWISWQSNPEGDDAGPLRRALTAFRDTAAAHELVIGVGGAHRGVAGLMRSVAEARLAAHVARESGTVRVQWLDQVGPKAALAWLPTAEIARVAALCLPELTGARDRVTLVDTARAVLDHGGSLSQASRRLGVHRNTVLARLARARHLGLAYDDPEQRLALHLLCYALGTLWQRPASPDEGPVAPDQGQT